MSGNGYVYMLATERNGTLYIGVTSNLLARIYQHKEECTSGFTKQYNVKRLVYFEIFDNIAEAITREKQLKNWQRDWKIELLEKDNPNWDDLYMAIL